MLLQQSYRHDELVLMALIFIFYFSFRLQQDTLATKIMSVNAEFFILCIIALNIFIIIFYTNYILIFYLFLMSFKTII